MDNIDFVYLAQDKDVKLAQIKVDLLGLPNSKRITTIKDLYDTKSEKKWILFADLSDNKFFFHNEFYQTLEQLLINNNNVIFLDKRYYMKDSKCFIVKSGVNLTSIYDEKDVNTQYTYLTYFGNNTGNYALYHLLGYKFEDEIYPLLQTFTTSYELYFKQRSEFRFKYTYDFERHIFKFYKPFVFLINIDTENYDEIKQLVTNLSQNSYPFFRIVIISKYKVNFEVKRLIVISNDEKNKLRSHFVNMLSSCENVIVFRTNYSNVDLYRLNEFHNEYSVVNSDDFCSFNVFHYVEYVPNEIDSNDDIDYLVHLNIECYNESKNTKEFTIKKEEELFPRLERYLVRKDISEGLKVIYKEMETIQQPNKFQALSMILISFLAIAEDTQNIEKELFRATVVFKNDHDTYKQYFIIVENVDKHITPKFKKLF